MNKNPAPTLFLNSVSRNLIFAVGNEDLPENYSFFFLPPFATQDTLHIRTGESMGTMWSSPSAIFRRGNVIPSRSQRPCWSIVIYLSLTHTFFAFFFF